MFTRLVEYCLNIKASKCVLGVPKLDFLSHEVSQHGIFPSKERIEAIQSLKAPDSITKVQQFIGMINYYYYNRFIPRLAELLVPIYKHMTKMQKKPKIKFSWPHDCNESFIKVKESLTHATLLAHPLEKGHFSITTDASNFAIGAVLQQYNNSVWEPLAFFSKKISSTEMKYSAFDRELLGIYLAIKHFRYFVEGRHFVIYTDHKPITTAISSKAEKSPRQTRYFSYISQFTTDILHVSGKNNASQIFFHVLIVLLIQIYKILLR